MSLKERRADGFILRSPDRKVGSEDTFPVELSLRLGNTTSDLAVSGRRLSCSGSGAYYISITVVGYSSHCGGRTSVDGGAWVASEKIPQASQVLIQTSFGMIRPWSSQDSAALVKYANNRRSGSTYAMHSHIRTRRPVQRPS